MLAKVLMAATASLALALGGGLPAARAATPTPAITTATNGTASGSTATDGQHAEHGGNYLALGDSVPFGFDPLVPVGSAPTAYRGYPEVARRGLGLALTNLSCPGQTTAGFISLTGNDNGCFGFRKAAALHARYPGSQLDAALAFLASHPRTRLVTLTLGANDLFLCAKATADQCTSPAEVGATLRTAAANLTVALTAIRRVYHGPLIAVTYYAADYSTPAGTAAISALDTVLATVTTSFGGSVADGFAAFRKVAAGSGGSSCTAGLLIALPTGGCDVHPTPRGARLLARALVRAADAADDTAGHRV